MDSQASNITEKKHLGNLSILFFGRALDQMGQKRQYLAKNVSFGPKWAVFGPKMLTAWLNFTIYLSWLEEDHVVNILAKRSQKVSNQVEKRVSNENEDGAHF